MTVSNLYILFTSLNGLRSALLEAKTMKCKLCGLTDQGVLCSNCRDFLKWMYPDDEPEEILELYKRGLRGRKRK